MEPPDPAPPAPRSQLWLRLALVATFLGMPAAGVALERYTAAGMRDFEAHVRAGDFPAPRRLEMPLRVEESGVVLARDPALASPSRAVASLNLIPPGKYEAVIIVHDADPAHAGHSQVVVAARDRDGRWFPPEAGGWQARATPIPPDRPPP